MNRHSDFSGHFGCITAGRGINKAFEDLETILRPLRCSAINGMSEET